MLAPSPDATQNTNTTTNWALAAEKASMTCFLNSLLREWFDWSFADLPAIIPSQSRQGIRIDLKDATLWIPVRYASKLGRHAYEHPAYLEKAQQFTVLTFAELSQHLIEHLPVQSRDPEQAKARFSARVDDSVRAIEEVLRHRSRELLSPDHAPRTFVEAEQDLIIGHSFHPSPKSREGFSREDRFRFGPEYAGRFPLAWFLVAKDRIQKKTSVAFADKDWIGELIASDEELKDLVSSVEDGNFQLYPMNPWQAKYLMGLPRFKALLECGDIRFLGEKGGDWFPTSSVRSICRPKSPYMLKTSLNVRLTNSVRSLLMREVDRGLQVHDVFATTHGKKLLSEYPEFHVVYEPAYWCMTDIAGEPIEETIVICRDNPFTKEEPTDGLVLASLTQDHPLDAKSPIQVFIDRHQHSHGSSRAEASRLWFDRYVDVVVEPLLMAQANYGILLGAHQQNILVGLRDDIPHTLYFRDCQGTGYSQLAYDKLKDEVASLDPSNGNILPNEMAHTLFIYYLVINASFNVINTIAREGFVSEDDLIGIMRGKLLAILAKKPADPSCIEHLLSRPKIMHKGNFICSISDINENTSDNPLAIYTAIENPFFKAEAQETL